MAVGEFNRNKFSFQELITNSNGKNSGSGLAGFCIVVTGILFFASTIVGYWFRIPDTLEVMSNVIMFIGIGSALLGVRKVMSVSEDKK